MTNPPLIDYNLCQNMALKRVSTDAEHYREVTEHVTKEVTKEVELRMSELTRILLKENRLEELKRMTEDEAFRRELLGYYFP